MFKNLRVILFGVLAVFCSDVNAAIKPTEIIRKGTKLVYDVNYYGSNYEITVIVKDNTDDYNFDWYMSAPANGKGSLNLSKDAIENATGISSYFTNGEITLEDQCCIILSKKMYDAFKSKGTMEINTDKKNNISVTFGNPYDHTQSFGYRNNFSNEFNCRTVNNGSDYQITYVNDANFPLIMEMKLDWTLKLKIIYN